MHLIKRTSLYYREGRSDKVYEVDLCEVSPGRYVVNFRYGRRGSNLREGVETVQALPLNEAQRAFDKLVGSKVKKGYQEGDAPPASAPVPSPKRVQVVDPEARKRAVLKRLEEEGEVSTLAGQLNRFVQNVLKAGESNAKSKWPLERAIWRAGELQIREAAPLLVNLIGSGDALRDYCIAWALGWCGDPSAVPALQQLLNRTNTTEAVQRISLEAIFKLAPDSRAQGLPQNLSFWPTEWQERSQAGSTEELITALRTQRQEDPTQGLALLEALYMAGDSTVRPALLTRLRTISLKHGSFKHARRLFKVAEYRRDGEVFGLLSHRFEKERATYRSPDYGMYVEDAGERRGYRYLNKEQFKQYLGTSNALHAYSSATREYFRRRVWRTLRKLGVLDSPDYVPMATGVLLAYDDADALPPKENTTYRYEGRRTITETTRWDSWATYLPFNHILYTHSPRYFLKNNGRTWCCRPTYRPGGAVPSEREEAFPHLWEQQPQELLRLLEQSTCQEVHRFAVKVLRACPTFCSQLEISILIRLLSTRYEWTAQFIFALAQERYQPTAPNLDLVLAAAHCRYATARTTAYQWIEQKREVFLADTNFLAALINSPYADTCAFARRLLTASVLRPEVSEALVIRLLASLIASAPETIQNAKEIGELLLTVFSPQMRRLNLDIILDLIHHPLLEVQELGGCILLNHETSLEQLPVGLIASLINSSHEAIRALGIRLFSQVSQEQLLHHKELFAALVSHEQPDLRSAIRPVIRQLGREHPAFSIHLAQSLISVLLRREQHAGVHNDLLRVLNEDIPQWLADASPDLALTLLKAKSSTAQELGGIALQTYHKDWALAFEPSALVTLANHEILAVREAARSLFLQQFPQLRQDPQQLMIAARFLDGRWEDTRAFGRELFTTHLQPEECTPDLLINICDSVREDVQAFGRELITQHFQGGDGQCYLLRLSEHPSAGLQLFATNYLVDYAADNLERLRALTPYFVRVLSAVNRGRVAKTRIFDFLRQEALKSENAARLISEMLIRQSLTIAIGDKATALELMVQIHHTYPDISLPLKIVPPLQRASKLSSTSR
jgi:predicted DNA-binding WGR domain protein